MKQEERVVVDIVKMKVMKETTKETRRLAV